MSAEAHLGALFFECLFLNAFSDALFEPWTSFWRFWASIFAHFGMLFGAFSYLGSFLKIALPCRRELKNQGPGITAIAHKSNNTYVWLWDCFGSQFSKKLCNSG